jgi:hypothetical protein
MRGSIAAGFRALDFELSRALFDVRAFGCAFPLVRFELRGVVVRAFVARACVTLRRLGLAFGIPRSISGSAGRG